MMTIEEFEENQDLDILTKEAMAQEDAGDYSAARDKFRLIEMLSLKYGDKKYLAFSILSQAWISLHKLSDLNTADKKYAEAKKIFTAIQDKKKIKLILHDQAYLSLKKGEQEEALWLYGEYKRESKNDDLYNKFTSEMFADIVNPGKKDETIALERTLLEYEELKSLDEIVAETVTRCTILWAQAMQHSNEKKLDGAIALMDEYVGLNFKIGDREKVMDGLQNLGVFMYNMGKYDKAIEMFAGQEKYCRALADKKSLRKCLSNQASILRFKLEKYKEALGKCVEAEPLCIELNEDKSLIDNLQNQVWIQYEKAGDYESAYNKSQVLEKLCRKENNKEILEFCLKYQHNILKAWGEKKQAKAVKKELDSFKK